ncbi:MAG: sigma-70 family RNA polymerase sigma factor [Bacteroidota bacterium]|nr:sigma-70 family RNA polymerase sigma factor [Bacteroidota bacterium]
MSIEDLIEGCKKEDRVCQRELYNMFAGKMMAVCIRYAKDRMEAEDILQDGFIKLFDNVSSFKNEGSFEGWIKRIFVNTALNKIRMNKREFRDIDDVALNLPFDDQLIEKMSENDILEIIRSMPEGYKYVFNLYAIEGFSHKEIADSLGIEEASSRSQYSKAKKYLQQKIISLEKVNL